MNEPNFQDGTDAIIGAAFEVANTLGAGFLEKSMRMPYSQSSV